MRWRRLYERRSAFCALRPRARQADRMAVPVRSEARHPDRSLRCCDYNVVRCLRVEVHVQGRDDRKSELRLTDTRKFRIALIGCGRISRNHIDAVSKIDGLEIV